MVKIDIEGVFLTTDRLILRAFLQKDLNDLFEYASVSGVGEMAGWGHHKSIAESQKILDRFIDEKNTFAIVLRDSGKVIGSLGLHDGTRLRDDESRSHLKSLEIGYVLSKDFWGQGFAVEAVQAVCEYCFTALGLDAIICTHTLDNLQSKRVIEKSGFSYLRPAVLYSEAFDICSDGSLYILSKEDYEQKKQ